MQGGGVESLRPPNFKASVRSASASAAALLSRSDFVLPEGPAQCRQQAAGPLPSSLSLSLSVARMRIILCSPPSKLMHCTQLTAPFLLPN